MSLNSYSRVGPRDINGNLYFSSWVISLLVARRIHYRVVSIRCTMVRGKGASLKKTFRRLAPAVTVKRIAL